MITTKEKERGFTFIEMIVVVALVAVMAAMTSFFYSNYYLKTAAQSADTQLTAELRKAQMYSVMDKQGSGWGVTFTGGNIVLYEGNTYASSIPAFSEIYSVPASVGVSGFGEIDFARVTGLPHWPGLAGFGTTTVMITGAPNTYTIVINPRGIVVNH